MSTSDMFTNWLNEDGIFPNNKGIRLWTIYTWPSKIKQRPKIITIGISMVTASIDIIFWFLENYENYQTKNYGIKNRW